MSASIFTNAKGLLLDLNGVFYEDNQLLPGAVETLQVLSRRGIPCRFTTNTTTKTRRSLSEHLQGLGLAIQEHEILSPPQAAVLYLRRKKHKRCHLLMADDLKNEFREFTQDHTRPEAIVIGDIGERWNYPVMNHLFEMIMYGAELVALHRGRYWQTENKLRLDIGAFVAGLEYATGKPATVIGKPSPTFFQMAVEELGVPAERVVMIGDDIEMDVGGAQAAGLRGALVATGKYRAELVAASGIRADALLPSIADLPGYL